VEPKYREEDVYKSVISGELTIDDEGRIWRVAICRKRRKYDGYVVTPCKPRRAEHVTGNYLQVRIVIDGIRYHALAHRLV
jgi:hypothetical protein